MSAEKLSALQSLLRSYGSCLIAYSGGVDSVFLAHVAHAELGDRALAVIADSPSLARQELADALEFGRRFGFPVRVIPTAEFDNEAYLANPANRCYFCKHELFSRLIPLARQEGFAVIAYGENATDAGDFRPGSQAAAEFQVRAPLKDVGLSKAEIRELSAGLGLPTADKPQMACLSSRVPQGERVTPEKLRRIEAAEALFRARGYRDIRVRHHELPAVTPAGGTVPQSGAERCLARIELGAGEFPALLVDPDRERLVDAVRALGYQHVTLDLKPYRRAGAEPVSITLRTSQTTVPETLKT